MGKPPPTKEPPKHETIVHFYAVLGSAIARWQKVEMGLCLVFNAIAASKRKGAIMTAFHSLQNFLTQLKMTDVALQVLFVQEPKTHILKEEWECLYERADKQYKTRNILVHSLSGQTSDNKAEHQKMYLMPQIADLRYDIGLRKKSKFTIPEITSASEKFEQLSNDLMAFVLKLRNI